MKHDLQNGLVNENRVLTELKRRGIPFKHRVQIEYYEVDVIVGESIIIEVDGYVHLTKSSMDKDKRKEDLLNELGFNVLRITSHEVKNKGTLRDFVQKVEELWKEEKEILKPIKKGSLTQNLAAKELHSLKEELTANKSKPVKKKKKPLREKLTDEELFKQWIDKEPPPDKD